MIPNVRSERPSNQRHLLGRLYGYVHQATAGIGLGMKARHQFTRELLEELLLTSNLFDRVQAFVQHNDADFIRGWEEGRRYHAAAVANRNDLNTLSR